MVLTGINSGSEQYRSLLTLQTTFLSHQPPQGVTKNCDFCLNRPFSASLKCPKGGLMKQKIWPKVSRGSYTVLIQCLFLLKPYFWSNFEQNLEKRVFCLYHGRILQLNADSESRVGKAEMRHDMAYGVFLLPVGLIRKARLLSCCLKKTFYRTTLVIHEYMEK